MTYHIDYDVADYHILNSYSRLLFLNVFQQGRGNLLRAGKILPHRIMLRFWCGLFKTSFLPRSNTKGQSSLTKDLFCFFEFRCSICGRRQQVTFFGKPQNFTSWAVVCITLFYPIALSNSCTSLTFLLKVE